MTSQKSLRNYAYIFVASRDRDVAIVPLRSHHGLNAVRDQIPRLQAVAHPPRPHRDRVANPDRIKPEPNHPGLSDPVLDGLGQPHEVHVASVALVPDGRYADLGLLHVVVVEADAVEAWDPPWDLGSVIREL